MTTPFDAIAQRYDELWNDTANGRRQRLQVWREFDRLFGRGDFVIDLGCGCGDDALHLASAGVRVIGIDSSEEMIRTAQARGVDARRLQIEELAVIDGPLDGAISNFGALNCVADLAAVARELGRLVRPGHPIALCFISRFWLQETAAFLLNLRFRDAFRRWSGQVEWRGLVVRYPSSHKIRKVFSPWFRFIRRVRIGGGDHSVHIFERRISC
jgi:ubiquinone/menaquinone biosynthesis C-methylase UbiE